MISLSRPIITARELAAVSRVLKSGHLAQGREVTALESEFTRVTQAKYAVAVCNGTAALHLALLAAGIGVNDEVITTPFTFVATANPIMMVGAKPVFVDIDPGTYNINPVLVEQAITPKTRAIIAVDLYGLPADYTSLKRIVKKHKLILIEDAAQSIGARYKNIPTGNLGDLACFSLYATKNVMCGEGGVITTNNRNYYKLLRQLRHHGQQEGKKYRYVRLGYNYRMTDLQAAIARVQLGRLQTITKKRQFNARFLTHKLKYVSGLVCPEIPVDCTHVFHQYTLRINSQFSLSRDELQQLLDKSGIMSGVHYPVPLNEVAHFAAGSKKFKETKKASKEVVSLPVHPLLSMGDLRKIVDIIKRI